MEYHRNRHNTLDMGNYSFNTKSVMSRLIGNYDSKNGCTYDRQTIKGIAYIPTLEQYMCLSIRIYYAKKEFIKIGMSNEDAERIAKTIVG